MIKLDDISRIGFGGYRIRNGNLDHETSLKYAIEKGCNLIDTAASYGNGSSEELIGKVILESKKTNNVFIISKAGYIFNSNKELLDPLNRNILKHEDALIEISNGLKYSIHPYYLDQELNRSLKRLNREYIDCYLLHNPEYHFRDNNFKEERYYAKFLEAFEFLEKKVEQGVLRYYGVSSNTFPFSIEERDTTKLNKLIDIANNVSQKNHFKFIQFPFNLVEDDAVKFHQKNSHNLISLAKKNNIKTISNRPFNANTEFGVRRLTIYNTTISETEFKLSMENFFSIIEKKLVEKGYKESIEDFEVLGFMQRNHTKINNHKILFEIQNLITSFIEMLFQNDISRLEERVMSTFKYDLEEWSKKQSSIETKNLLKTIDTNIDFNKTPSSIINKYLNTGVNHVLCGMKKKNYVNDLKDLF